MTINPVIMRSQHPVQHFGQTFPYAHDVVMPAQRFTRLNGNVTPDWLLKRFRRLFRRYFQKLGWKKIFERSFLWNRVQWGPTT